MNQPHSKKLRSCFSLLFLLIGSYQLVGQSTIEPVIDFRVETMSIIFRLAGRPEYNDRHLISYVKDIEAHFLPFQKHPVVLFAKGLPVGFDGVMTMAVHVSNAPEFKPLVPFSKDVPDERWGKKNAEKFSVLLRDFYKDADCEKFFNEHEAYYKTAVKNFKASMLRGVDVNWYSDFYGEKPSGNYNLIIGLGNGGNNYGAKVAYANGREDLFSIVNNALPDSLGFATFKPENIQSTIIHEYNHSYINHLIYAQPKAFTPQIKNIFAAVGQKMNDLHYGSWEIMVNESLVRAGEIQYDKMHGSSDVDIAKRIRNEQARGFVWMDKLDSLLEVYKSNRTKHPTFKSFVPEIATFYKSLEPKAKKLVSDFENCCAHVVRIEPLSGALEIESTITELSIHFDKPMGTGISINLNDKGMEHFPLVRSKESVKWSEDSKTLTLKVSLKPSREYGFVLTPLSFKTRDGYPLSLYEVSFKTR